MDNFKFELDRKIFHLLGILCPIIYIFLPKLIAFIILFCITLCALLLDIYRHNYPIIQRILLFLFKKIMREEELSSKKLASTSWMALGLLLSCLIYDKNIAIFSWLVLFICDSVAAIIGTKFGETKLIGNKTLEGSFAFFICSIIIGLIYYNFAPGSFSFLALLSASAAGTFAELYSKKFEADDNFTIPVIVGFFLSIF